MALALQLTLLLQRMLLTESVVSRRSWTRRTHGTSIALGMRWHASSTFKCPVHDCNIFHCKLLRRPPGLACFLPPWPTQPSVLWQENLSWSRGQNASRNSIGPVRGTWNVFAMGMAMATLRTTSSRMRWLTLASDVRNRIAS